MAKNLFWSYAQNVPEEFPDSLVIEQTLLLGDVEDLQQLFQHFSSNDIRMIWEQQLVPQQRHHKLNFYLGKMFFGVKNIESFLSERTNPHPRLDRLRLLVAEHK